MSSSIQMILRSGVQNFTKWQRNPRIYVLFLILFCLIFDILSPFNGLARQFGTRNTMWFLPFLVSGRFIGFYFLMGIVLLFCDAPFIDRIQPYVIIRVGKVKWAIGQIFYIMLASLLFAVVLQLMIFITLIPTISFSCDWGSVLYTVSQIGIPGFYPSIDIRYSIINTYSPISATLLEMFMLWLEGIFLGILMFYANLKFGRTIGTGIGCFFAMMFLMIKSFIENVPMLWKITPTIWMEIAELTNQTLGTHPGIPYGIMMLTILIIVLSVGSIREIKRKPIEILEQI